MSLTQFAGRVDLAVTEEAGDLSPLGTKTMGSLCKDCKVVPVDTALRKGIY